MEHSREAGIDQGSPYQPPPEQERAGQGTDATHRSAAGAPRRRGRASLEFLAIVVLALAVALGLRAWVVEAYYIPSGSMIPTLQIGDRILVDKLSFDFNPVRTGEIVVFRRPPADTVAPQIADLVKRVVGLPGQTIASGPGAQVLINGKPIAQPWLTAQAKADPGPAIRTQVIPKGQYFMMGDNRGNSEDSRFFGTVPGSLIVGRVVTIAWPPSQWRYFGALVDPLAPQGILGLP